jgi:hypothetical protein
VTATAAIVFAIAVAGVVAFQLGLALGAPWGAYAMGGRYPDRFPPAMRVAAVVQAIVLALLALLVLSAAGLVLPSLANALPWAAWIAVAFSAVSLVLNLITPSAVERRLWAPVGAVMLLTSLTVALTAG